MNTEVSFFLLLVLISGVLGKPPPIRTYGPESTFSNCLQLGPYASDVNTVFRVEWNFAHSARTLDVRFTARNNRGFVGLGFVRGDQSQIVLGHPTTDLRCVQAMYNSYLPLDADARPYNYDIEVPMQHIEDRDYDVRIQLRRNLTLGGKRVLANPNAPFNFTILWAYRIHSIVSGMCNDFSMVPQYTEAATFSVILGSSQYANPGGNPSMCKVFRGRLTAQRRALDRSAGFFAAENHQNNRIAVLFIGGGLPLESGRNAPLFNSVEGYVQVGSNSVCHASISTASCRFAGFRDSVGGIAYYEVAFGVPGNLQKYLPWTFVGSVQVVAKTVTLPSNQTIVCSVRAFNYAGRYTEVSSRPARVLAGTSPIDGGYVTINGGKTAQKSSTSLTAAWYRWRTEDYSTQNIATRQWVHNTFEYAIGVVGANATGVKNWQPVTGTLVTVSNLRLRNNVRYAVSVRAKNCAGTLTMAVSPPVLVDLYPPSPGLVYDGNVTFRDAKYTRVNTGVSASWGGFFDTGSGIDYYEWAVGTKNPKLYGPTTEILAWTNVGKAVFVTDVTLKKETQKLAVGSMIYIHVRAVDKVGWSTVASSNGTTVVGY